jgi:hypothetical protein
MAHVEETSSRIMMIRRSEDELSLVTFLVYLDDGCEGGATLIVSGQSKFGNVSVAPETGLGAAVSPRLAACGYTARDGAMNGATHIEPITIAALSSSRPAVASMPDATTIAR